MAAGTAEVNVANLALLHLGELTVLTSLSDSNDIARSFSRVWELTRRSVLGAHFWPFATKRARLAADTTAPDFDFDKRYKLPGDFVQTQELYPREIMWREEGGFLLTDEGGPLDLVYTFDEDNLGAWHPLALDALAYRLAANACYAVTGTRERIGELERQYRDQLAQARHMVSISGHSTREFDQDVWLHARHGGSAPWV